MGHHYIKWCPTCLPQPTRTRYSLSMMTADQIAVLVNIFVAALAVVSIAYAIMRDRRRDLSDLKDRIEEVNRDATEKINQESTKLRDRIEEVNQRIDALQKGNADLFNMLTRMHDSGKAGP